MKSLKKVELVALILAYNFLADQVKAVSDALWSEGAQTIAALSAAQNALDIWEYLNGQSQDECGDEPATSIEWYLDDTLHIVLGVDPAIAEDERQYEKYKEQRKLAEASVFLSQQKRECL